MPRSSESTNLQRSDLSADRLALAVAGHGHGSVHVLPATPVPDPIFDSLLEVGRRDRLTGAIAQLVAEGALPVTERQRNILTEGHLDWIRHVVQIERVLVDVGRCYSEAGIDVRVVKGAALAHLVYADPSWRVFSDIDLVVPSDQFDEAARLACTMLGGEQPVPEIRPGFDHKFGKEALIEIGRVELDIHRTFVTGPFGLTIDLDDLFRPGLSFHIGENRFSALDGASMFMHAAYNLALGDYPVRLCSLRDLMVVYERLNIDTSTIAATAVEWRSTAVVQRAAQLAVDLLGLDSSHGLANLGRLAVPRREAWLLRSYLTSARSYSRPLASVVVIPGLRNKMRYATSLFAPSDDYLRSRGWTERGHLRVAANGLLRRG